MFTLKKGQKIKFFQLNNIMRLLQNDPFSINFLENVENPFQNQTNFMF